MAIVYHSDAPLQSCWIEPETIGNPSQIITVSWLPDAPKCLVNKVNKHSTPCVHACARKQNMQHRVTKYIHESGVAPWRTPSTVVGAPNNFSHPHLVRWQFPVSMVRPNSSGMFYLLWSAVHVQTALLWYSLNFTLPTSFWACGPYGMFVQNTGLMTGSLKYTSSTVDPFLILFDLFQSWIRSEMPTRIKIRIVSYSPWQHVCFLIRKWVFPEPVQNI